MYVDGREKLNIASQNEYIQELLQRTKLEILQKDKVTKAYTSNKEIGLFHLFLTKEFFKSLRTWTNTRLEEKGKKSFYIEIFGVRRIGIGNVDYAVEQDI